MRTPLAALPLLVLSCAGAPRSAGPALERTESRTPSRPPSCALEMPPLADEWARGPAPEALAAGVLGSSINRDLIRVVVRENLEDVRACYREGLARDPALEGRLALRWDISTMDGSVSEVELSDTSLEDPCVVICVMKQVETWIFPAFHGREGSVTITYPFHFTSE